MEEKNTQNKKMMDTGQMGKETEKRTGNRDGKGNRQEINGWDVQKFNKVILILLIFNVVLINKSSLNLVSHISHLH